MVLGAVVVVVLVIKVVDDVVVLDCPDPGPAPPAVVVGAAPDPVTGVPEAVMAEVAWAIETAPVYGAGPGMA